MVLSLQYGHGFFEMVLSLKRGYDFEGSIHGFCHGWQNGFPGTLKSCSRPRMGSVLVFSCSRVSETQLFLLRIMDSATSGFRRLTFFFRSVAFFNTLIFTVFKGAAAAAAGSRWGFWRGFVVCARCRLAAFAK